jgi:predicted ribosome quality control (RQC) complex YloA/Tae2 family protein
MPTIDYLRTEIERMRNQVLRQKKEIRQLQDAGINSTAAEALLARMRANIDNLCSERDRLKKEEPRPHVVLGGRKW